MRDSRRFASLGLTLASALAVGGALVAACYDVPKPACGFRCGPANECPADYTCAPTDGFCHLNGAPATTCGPALDDAGVVDGADAPISDAPPDAPEDAPPDAPPDASPDAPPDAAPDAMI